MTYEIADTIAAISTAPGAAAVGLVRISGERSLEVLRRLVSSPGNIVPRRVRAGWVTDSETGEKIDHVLFYYLNGPATYTGEDMVELHGHGGVRNMERLFQSVLKAGVRTARPGEFTMRAFLKGKMDLIRAEAVLSIVSARSERALQAAQSQLGGNLSNEIEAIRTLMISQLARIEASIDFPDDAGETTLQKDAVDDMERRLDALVGRWNKSRRLVEGLRVVLTGKPNVGKSSLLNAVIGKTRAIVDERPGTTRDYIEAAVEIQGHSMTLVDTAGLRERGDRIEIMGMQAAREVMGEADVILLLIDDTGLSRKEFEMVRRQSKTAVLIPLLNKSDLSWTVPAGLSELLRPLGPLHTSCVSGHGIGELESRLVEISGGDLDMTEPLLTNTRHLRCVQEAGGNIRTLKRLEEEGQTAELIASYLKGAVSAMDEMTGRECIPDMLDEIFSRFCIGK